MRFVSAGSLLIGKQNCIFLNRNKEEEEEEEEERKIEEGEGAQGRMTFLSLFFSAISSFPALAACRDSCLEVNFEVVYC